MIGIRRTLYSLKREYGDGPLAVYSLIDSTTDLSTGEKTISKAVTIINTVIVLPAKLQRDVVQGISQISANKSFAFGGYYDSRTRTFIIDRLDCPDLVELKDDDWLVFDGRKYEIKSVQEFGTAAWVVIARHQIGDTPEQIHVVSADHLIPLDDNT